MTTDVDMPTFYHNCIGIGCKSVCVCLPLPSNQSFQIAGYRMGGGDYRVARGREGVNGKQIYVCVCVSDCACFNSNVGMKVIPPLGNIIKIKSNTFELESNNFELESSNFELKRNDFKVNRFDQRKR